MAAVPQLEFQPDVWGAPAAPRHLHLVPRQPGRPSAAVHRRRRIVVGVVAVVLLTGALRASVPASDPPSARLSTPASVHVVRPGDTYWSIASSVADRGPLLEAVDALVAANGGRLLHPGDSLVLPS